MISGKLLTLLGHTILKMIGLAILVTPIMINGYIRFMANVSLRNYYYYFFNNLNSDEVMGRIGFLLGRMENKAIQDLL